MSDYKLSFLPDIAFVNRLLAERGISQPSATLYPQDNQPVGTCIGGSPDQVLSVLVNSDGGKRKLRFFLQDPNADVQVKSVPVGSKDTIARVELFELNPNPDGSSDLIAVAVDGGNNFYSGAIAYATGNHKA
jgi:hypothetical protein